MNYTQIARGIKLYKWARDMGGKGFTANEAATVILQEPSVVKHYIRAFIKAGLVIHVQGSRYFLID